MSIETILPTNIDQVINDLDVLGAERLEKIGNEAAVVEDLRDPMAVDARFLPVLAEDYQTYFLDEATSEGERRRMIAASLMLHRKKGTLWAVKNAFAIYGMNARIVEWFEYGGEPYGFVADLSSENREITKQLVANARAAVEEFKNVRSHLVEMRLGYLNRLTQGIACGGVGESCASVDHATGYMELAAVVQAVSAGGVGESYSAAEAIGYTHRSHITQKLHSGAVGETVAYATMEA